MNGNSRTHGSRNTKFSGSRSTRFVGRQGTSTLGNEYAISTTQIMQSERTDEIDSMMGFNRYVPAKYEGKFTKETLHQVPGKIGWLANMHPILISPDKLYGNSSDSSSLGVSGVDFYFLDEQGGYFKSTITYDPYFFVTCTNDTRIHDVEEFLKKHLESCVKTVETVQKEDLSLDNHLTGLKKSLVKLTFTNNNNLFEARKLLRPILLDNEANKTQRNIYKNVFHRSNVEENSAKSYIEGIREYDVPYHVRVSIDKDIRVGKWYKVTANGFFECTDRVAFADPVVLAFDIETTKAPLKFPDSSIDQIMMISYIVDGDGFLITNREIISDEIEDFEYTPKPEFPGHFTIFNEPDELGLLHRFFEHIREVKPTLIATFNGDFFDWPFVENRAKINGLNMYDEIGFKPDSEGEYKSSYCTHMDCYRWVKRDSYLPQGSQGLKAVTQAKLGYNPIELDPELMTPYAYEKPQELSEYSVSDAVATYYLYMKYVHPFIFSLCTIIPLNPDEVLRKGTGTLCEMLLMVQAYHGGILLPNKYTDPLERFYDGHLLESETYVGGHVESLEAGVFRSDLETHFKIDTTAIDELLVELNESLRFCIEKENNARLEDVMNFDEVKEQITSMLTELKHNNSRHEKPLIYHVDVASMYPNIMTTNRLQPDSMKTERDCASCDFNRPGKTCARRLKWSWRGEFFPAKTDEYNMIKRALQNETFPNKNKFSKKPFVTFDELSYADQMMYIRKRLTDYSKKVYHKIKTSEIVEREAIVCQRENPFYVDTVKSFRDRRYEFKGLAKTWKGKMSAIDNSDKHAKDEAKKMIVLYDSLQLAHKVILNSFYGYVMRKGSRWYSMEMAGITCLTGATIIQLARALVERIGRPLELDTDGIWCIVPSSFPENFVFKLNNGKKLYLSYPCTMLNYRVHQKFTNHQYQTLVDPVKHKYETHSENSIFFEVDGPYRAMVLPTSKEEGKGIKKRYAVFNDDGSLAELKGFEMKRRGELQLIKSFQSEIFKVFLQGNTLQECYSAVAEVSNRWLDILDSKGAMLEDDDLIELICENKSMSKTLKEYEGQKSTSITTAKRLGEFLGEEMVKDKGLQCKYIISSKPPNAAITERAIPVAILSADISVKRSFLRRWTMDMALDNVDIRTIIDWGYYRERLASVIQKIITIPAALQNIPNPVPKVEHPDWLKKRLATESDKFKQSSINNFLKSVNVSEVLKTKDIEDLFQVDASDGRSVKTAKITSRQTKRKRNEHVISEESLVLPSEMPSIENDYIGWLNYQKILWKIQKRDKMRRNQLFGNSDSAVGRSALGNLIRRQAESYANSNWHILSYRESSESGSLKVFVLIDGKLQMLKFIVPKVVYLKLKSDRYPPKQLPHAVIEKSSASLPNHPSLNSYESTGLYKVTLPESTYIDECNNFSSAFNDENVLGIFESHVSASQRAVIELGNSVAFKSNIIGSLGKGLQKGFEMRDLVSMENTQYLKNFDVPMVHLIQLGTNIGYEIMGLFITWTNDLKLYVIKPSTQAQQLNQTLVKEALNEASSLKNGSDTTSTRSFSFDGEMNLAVDHVIDLKQAIRRVSTELNKLKEDKGQQFLMVLQTPQNKKIINSVKILNSLPIVELGIKRIKLPQLNWQGIFAKRFAGYLKKMKPSIDQLISLANETNIPLCNLNLQSIEYVIDILYARKLKTENIVLWWNEKLPVPDIGGLQCDYGLSVNSMANSSNFQAINKAGVYDTVVLEVGINNLIVNTILASALVNEAEGSVLNENTDLIDADGKPLPSHFVQDAFSNESMLVLRNLLKEWWDKALNGNATSDLLVNSIVKWVQNPQSRLFDDTLKHHIINLARKSLYQLINEFDLLGSSVIYGDNNNLLIKTKKLSPETCYAYSQYIMRAVRSNPLFTFLDMEIKRYWDILLWMDKSNFSGLACTMILEQEKQNLVAFSQWHINKYLPNIYQTEFDDWMMIILDAMVKSKHAILDGNDCTQRLTQLPPQESEMTDTVETQLLSGFTQTFSKPLIKRIQKLLENQQQYILDPQYASYYKFPKLPGSQNEAENPLLQFVKHLSHVLLLSRATQLEVRQLRKDILKIFEIPEFSKKAEFEDPAKSLILDNIVCSQCAFVLNFDMCKLDDKSQFRCDKCSKLFDVDFLQQHMISRLNNDIGSYLVQDLRCEKCFQVKKRSMEAHCSCSGSWMLEISEELMKSKLKTYKQVADFFEFNLLQEAIKDYCI